MKRRRNISLFFVQLAMFVFMIHAIVPHCHHANGQVMFFFHNYYCEHVHSDHHHCDEACHHGSHFCHHHHAGDHDEDCVLNKPFIKGDNKVHLESIDLPTMACFIAVDDLFKHLVDDYTVFANAYPTADFALRDYWHVNTSGLRAPPIL